MICRGSKSRELDCPSLPWNIHKAALIDLFGKVTFLKARVYNCFSSALFLPLIQGLAHISQRSSISRSCEDYSRGQIVQSIFHFNLCVQSDGHLCRYCRKSKWIAGISVETSAQAPNEGPWKKASFNCIHLPTGLGVMFSHAVNNKKRSKLIVYCSNNSLLKSSLLLQQ